MAAKRGRTISNHSQLFAGLSGGQAEAAPTGQPVMVRMFGIPTMPGYRDRPGKWNLFPFILPPLLLEGLRRLAGLLSRWS
jgi:hypothetical protein